ncbi:uncharacterized protein LOC114350285 [Ostrinia furnacalis]|uniref:uncharacterized protein LOC114350285 n=1 Tax=Ostrinia furnacalis TaxID=93504 RepID=UPI00103CCD64|nr:uncharacterized protein LOC114350285 [Ostrinia furnacalis]
MSNIFRNLKRPLLPTRPITTTQVLNIPRSLVKLRKIQADFQCEDGRPIWLKAGFRDRVLYTSTIVGCWVGVFMVLATIYENAKPPSWKTNIC